MSRPQYAYDLVNLEDQQQYDPHVTSIESGDVVNELPPSPKAMSLFDTVFLFAIKYADCRIKRFYQIKFWFRTFIEFSAIFCFFGLIIMMAILS